MNFDPTEEQRLVREMARTFVEKEVKPAAHCMDHEGAFPAEPVKKLAAIGFMGTVMPPEFGGAGMDFLSYVISVEEISKAWASLGVIMTVHNSLVCYPIFRFGSDRLKKKYLSRLSRGELLGCYALTEPGAGSDAASIQTSAEKKGDHFVLNGTKLFITNASHADLAIVFAATGSFQGKKRISSFLVDKGTPGFSVGKLEDKLGLRASDTAELIFQDCQVPQENMLGQEGEGLRIALQTLDGGRIGIAAQALGIAQACLEESLAYAKQRRQFGQAIAEFQAIRWMLADMATEIDGARLLTYRAASMFQQGRNVTKQAAMAKLFASEAANRSAYKAVQIFGGYGYIKDYPVERLYRDARITTLYEGTSEIQRLVIARQLIHGEANAHEF